MMVIDPPILSLSAATSPREEVATALEFQKGVKSRAPDRESRRPDAPEYDVSSHPGNKDDGAWRCRGPKSGRPD